MRINSVRTICVKAALDILPLEPLPGQCWFLTGTSFEHSVERYGRHLKELVFTPLTAKCLLPHDGEAFIQFLSKEPSFVRIGEVMARKIWQTFDEQIFSLLEKKDSAALRTVSRLSEESIQSLFEGFIKYTNLRYTTHMATWGIPLPIQLRLIKYHGAKAVAQIQQNPYRTLHFGLSFDTADKIAKNHFDIEDSDPRRLAAALNEALMVRSSQGHTLTEFRDLRPLVCDLLKTEELTDLALAVPSGKMFVRTEQGYSSFGTAIMARTIALRLQQLAKTEKTWNTAENTAVAKACQALPYSLSEAQKMAVVSAVSHHVSYISGGAGTGKTTVVNTVVTAYNELKYQIIAVALSGRAAMRLRESVKIPTSTIAAFLKAEVPSPKQSTLMIIDEASMIDLPTMFRIVNHLDPSVRLLFVGDPAQLPPIGPGAVLIDILRSGLVAGVELDVIHRQCSSTGIPEYSIAIRQQTVPQNLSSGAITYHDVAVKEIAETCAKLYAQSPKNTRVVAYRNSIVDSINTICQRRLNVASPALRFIEYGEAYDTGLRLNDPVLITRNNYKLGVQNGTLATLVDVKVMKNTYGSLLLDTGKILDITRTLLDDLKLGYAITLHKAQGSQEKRIIVAIEPIGELLDCSWVYTAVTRAEQELHLVGPKAVFASSVARSGSQYRRQTLLGHQLTELYQ
ncbi:MAG: AAA family ATPase [Lentisphaeraceae bacterium]|nr:AAA family ATPase [Lentisphaeraceae bacterium]